MSCSKVFSGDLPELTYGIIKYLQNDFSTLYSCILVNRFWCRLTIPLLWENPFSIPTENYNFIEIYLHYLNDDIKTKLNELNIINISLPSNTLFNYPSFLKYLNIYKFIFSIKKWFEVVIKTSSPDIQDSDSASIFEKLIYMSLFKIFIKHKIYLRILEIEISNAYYGTYFNNILELILQNPNFIHNIKNLNFYIGISSDCSYHKNTNDSNEYTLIKYHISQIINLHQNLKKILLDYNSFPFYQSLLLSKDYNCSNTLNTIILYRVNFKDINNLKNIFEQLNVLQSIHIIYCCSLNTDFIQQIITLTKPFKLKTLFINKISQIESLQLLLQKFGDYLENFGYGFEFNYNLSLKKQKLLESVTKYCKNIKFLDLCENDNQINYSIFNLIENIKQNLNYLSISTCDDNHSSIWDIWNDYCSSSHGSSIILQNLGQTLPSNLEYLHLKLHHIKASDFEVFLKSSQDTFIKKLVIYHRDSQDILPSVKEHVMKKKKVKYLAINDSSFETTLYNLNYNSRELSSLKNEVKEFELYNIRVQSYYSLAVSVYGFIRDID